MGLGRVKTAWRIHGRAATSVLGPVVAHAFQMIAMQPNFEQ
jgi:hypothetical protein